MTSLTIPTPVTDSTRRWSREKWIERFNAQREREEYLTDLGVDRFGRRTKKDPLSGAARKLLQETTEDTSRVIYSVLSKTRTGPRPAAEFWVKELDTNFRSACDKAGFLVSKALLNTLGMNDMLLRDQYNHVARLVLAEIRYDRLARLSPHLFKHKIERFQEDNMYSYAFMSRSLDSAYKVAQCTECYESQSECEHLPPLHIPHATRIHLGTFLIDCFLAATDEYTLARGHKAGVFYLAEPQHRSYGRQTRRERFLVARSGALEWLTKNNERLALFDHEHGPMLVPPLHWERGDKRGGYRFRLNGRYGIFKNKSSYPRKLWIVRS